MAKPPSPERGKRRSRCAIYTRKSSDEGLDQDFNSLDAQREACEAFIRSQQHEGWDLVRTPYDDGGFSGGTMERPGLKRLLDDVSAGKVDVIVVYKVDRLTRSLADFAKMVEVLDAQGVSFVSITQQFNTTTSMGRLTLNVLLSFAQFEREVTGERIRDKIAASKRKGMWMGGLPPLGYDCRDRKLVLNEPEAAIVRGIFERYLALGSVRLLQQELASAGIVSKQRANAAGRRWGGNPLARGALYLMLQNRLYLGEIVHHDQTYPGQHPSIIAPVLWDQVQQTLGDNRVERASGARAAHPSLLAGMLFDDRGIGMTPSHAVKNGTRYRYYVSRSLVTGTRSDVDTGCRVPAGDIEALVSARVRDWLSDPKCIVEIAHAGTGAALQKRLVDGARKLSARWRELAPVEHSTALRGLVSRIDLRRERIDIHLVPGRLAGVLTEVPAVAAVPDKGDIVVVSVPARLKRTGIEIKLVVEGERSLEPDIGLIKLLLKARALHTLLVSGEVQSIEEIARREGLSGSYTTRLLRLAFLAPDLTTIILKGNHPPELKVAKLLRGSRLPLNWTEQRVALGFA